MIVPVFFPHLGCGKRCIYCNQAVITDIGDIKTKDSVARSLGHIRGTVEVGIYGGNILGLVPRELKRLFALFDPYREKISSFRITTKPEPLEEETIEILRSNNVGTIELGSPSFNDDVLHRINRGHTAQDVKTAFSRLRHEGFTVALQVMVGLPGETKDDIRQTAETLMHMMPHYVRIYPLVVLKETVLADMHEEGIFIPLPFEEAVARAAYVYLSVHQRGIPVVKMGLTDNEIIKENVIGGHYHPAFGYVVKSTVFYRAVRTVLKGFPACDGDITITLNGSDVPHLLGHKRSNMARFQDAGYRLAWKTGNIARDTFLIAQKDRTAPGTVFDALASVFDLI